MKFTRRKLTPEQKRCQGLPPVNACGNALKNAEKYDLDACLCGRGGKRFKRRVKGKIKFGLARRRVVAGSELTQTH